MMNIIRTTRIVFILLLILSPAILTAEKSFSDFQEKNWLHQGSALFTKAGNELKKDNIASAIETVREFLLVYPDHPEKMNALKLLSNAYKKAGAYNKAVTVDTRIYMDNPATEEGIRAWLEAAKGYYKTGDMARARFILEKIQEQEYSSNLAEEAALELKILKITSN